MFFCRFAGSIGDEYKCEAYHTKKPPKSSQSSINEVVECQIENEEEADCRDGAKDGSCKREDAYQRTQS